MHADVAVKVIDKKTFRNPNDFFQEAKAMFRSEHPNVVSIRVASQNDDSIFLSMPLYRRGSLARRIANGPLPLRDVLRIGGQILAGLGAIHARGTIHFDIKPSNVLFSDEGTAKIADFGQARDIGPNGVTLMPERMYAPGIPPEAFVISRRGTFESDVFQAGLTLYRALNGEPSFERQLQKHAADLKGRIISGKFPDRNEFLPHIPDRLRRVIRKAMNVDPAKRFASPAAFANAIAKVSITNNWKTELLPDEAIEWEAGANPTRLVKCMQNDTRWCVELHQDRRGKRYRWHTQMWKSGMNSEEAKAYLNQLFDMIG